MTTSEIALLGTMIPVLLALVAMLYRIGNIMGRLEQKLDDHEHRISTLETIMPRSYPSPPSRRR